MLDTGDKHFIGFFISPARGVNRYGVSSRRLIIQLPWSASQAVDGRPVFSAAVDVRIRKSVAVAGLLPFFARQQTKDLTDAEQYDAAFYKKFPSPMIYQMAAERPPPIRNGL